MKYSDINIFCCPECRGRLKFFEINGFDKDLDCQEVTEGSINCMSCDAIYPVIKSIPRFVSRNNYASSFGYQWSKFHRTQFGREQKESSKMRFNIETQWPDNLQGQLILEPGCGAGRFSEIALDTGAEVWSFDISEAVEVCIANMSSLESRRRHHVFWADIYKIPLPYEMFDKIFCLGVLQHCPDVKKAYLGLASFLKPEGELAVDCYLKQPLRDIFKLKYLFRPIFKWWKASWLFAFCSLVISVAYDSKLFFVKIPMIGRFISGLIPIGPLNYEPDYYFSVRELKNIKTLSMLDMLSPKYDNPQKISNFRLWMESANLEILQLATGYNGINARARRTK